MAHITLNTNYPGISGLLAYRPETAKPLCDLAEILLRGESTLTSGERELIATYVSARNDCIFCQHSHGAAAAAHWGGNETLVGEVKKGVFPGEITPKIRALLGIAGKVQLGGLNVTEADICAARDEGATDREIHDTVLIAAAFCMYNRYVDGLGTWAPENPDDYRESGVRLAERGYSR
jgi:uncharacterized peroxidase-related enzyme